MIFLCVSDKITLISQVLLCSFCWLNPAQARVGEAACRVDIPAAEKNFRNGFQFVLFSNW